MGVADWIHKVCRVIYVFVHIAMVPKVDVALPLISYDRGTRCNVTLDETEEGRLVSDVVRTHSKEA